MKPGVVVVAWDFSEYAKAALAFALNQFEPADIRVLCVLERPNPYAFGVNWGPDAEENARKKCGEDFRSQAAGRTESQLRFITRFGEPAPQIARFAREQDADLIVMSTHGRTGFGQLVMGSVAQKVLARAECPVLVLPGRCLHGAAARAAR